MPAAAVARLLDVLVPRTCAGCGTAGAPCCADCLAALEPVRPPVCDGCGHPHAVPVPRCRECRGRVADARQACLYGDGPARLVSALKDDRRRDLGPVLARVIAARCPPPPAGAVLVPVPLSDRRHRRRGFNQSALIAGCLAGMWDLAVDEGLLARVREQPPQRGASRSERVRQVMGAFAVPARAGPVPPVCWLVDDVHTTGATLAACAAALGRGGVRRVGAVAFARALRT